MLKTMNKFLAIFQKNKLAAKISNVTPNAADANFEEKMKEMESKLDTMAKTEAGERAVLEYYKTHIVKVSDLEFIRLVNYISGGE